LETDNCGLISGLINGLISGRHLTLLTEKYDEKRQSVQPVLWSGIDPVHCRCSVQSSTSPLSLSYGIVRYFESVCCDAAYFGTVRSILQLHWKWSYFESWLHCRAQQDRTNRNILKYKSWLYCRAQQDKTNRAILKYESWVNWRAQQDRTNRNILKYKRWLHCRAQQDRTNRAILKYENGLFSAICLGI
jgi:hypothetical protein